MNRRTFILTVPCALLITVFHQEEKIISGLLIDPNKLICRKKFDFAFSLNLSEKPTNEVLIEIAKSFIGTDYAANTLETPDEERLIVNLETLDCVTFYENSLVLARCIKKGKMTFDDFKKELQFVRYRDGIIDGYPSRLHYTSDYFYDNEKKGVLKDITREIGGVLYNKNINFMSTHAESYPRLRESPEFIRAIKKIEYEINARKIYHIPKAKVKGVSSHIKDGDIIGITTSIEGLDCSHAGVALWQDKELHLLHASVPNKQVKISECPLWEYLAKIDKNAGIIVARPVEPKT